MADWSDWIQDVGKTAITSAVEAQYKQPFELQKMQLQAFGPFGQPYTEGSAQGPQSSAPVPQTLFGFPMWMVVVGGIAAIVMIEN